MGLAQLTGRYQRLKQDLAAAYGALPWHSGRIDRLANEIAATERELAAMAPLDEQRNKAACGSLEASPRG